MKIFAVQKTQANIYTPQFKQNSSVNQNSVTKTNLTGDKFVSKVAFGMASVNEMEKTLANLQRRLDTENLSKAIREALEDEIDTLKIRIEMSPGGGSEGGTTEHYAGIDPFRL